MFNDRIECGRWTVSYSDIKEAYVYKARQMFIPVTIIHLVTSEKSYQFGFNPWASPANHLQCEFEEKSIRLGYS